jgi:hypothetical protein
MFNSPFADSDLFLQATLTFKVQGAGETVDSRGNKSTDQLTVAHTFKLTKTSPNLRREYDIALLEELFYGTIVDGDGTLDIRIQAGDVAEGAIAGRKVTATLRSLAQSSIKVIPQILGEKYLLQVSYRSI